MEEGVFLLEGEWRGWTFREALERVNDDEARVGMVGEPLLEGSERIGVGGQEGKRVSPDKVGGCVSGGEEFMGTSTYALWSVSESEVEDAGLICGKAAEDGFTKRDRESEMQGEPRFATVVRAIEEGKADGQQVGDEFEGFELLRFVVGKQSVKRDRVH